MKHGKGQRDSCKGVDNYQGLAITRGVYRDDCYGF